MLHYQYVGRTAMTVVSPVTGRQYRFDRPGAVQQVDARDCQLLERVPNVKPVARLVGRSCREASHQIGKTRLY